MIKHLWAVKRKDKTLALFIVGRESCDICQNKLILTGIHYYAPNLENAEWILCEKCMENPPDYLRFGKSPNIRKGRISEERPANAFPIINNAQLQVSRSVSLFEAAGDKMPAVSVIDRTVRSGREDYTLDGDFKVGKNIEALNEERIEALSDMQSSVEGILEFHKYADPYIEEDVKKKQLEKPNWRFDSDNAGFK